MSNFSRIALKKLNDLIKQNDFLSISHVGAFKIRVLFKSKSCTIDNFGRVEWDL